MKIFDLLRRVPKPNQFYSGIVGMMEKVSNPIRMVRSKVRDGIAERLADVSFQKCDEGIEIFAFPNYLSEGWTIPDPNIMVQPCTEVPIEDLKREGYPEHPGFLFSTHGRYYVEGKLNVPKLYGQPMNVQIALHWPIPGMDAALMMGVKNEDGTFSSYGLIREIIASPGTREHIGKNELREKTGTLERIIAGSELAPAVAIRITQKLINTIFPDHWSADQMVMKIQDYCAQTLAHHVGAFMITHFEYENPEKAFELLKKAEVYTFSAKPEPIYSILGTGHFSYADWTH